MYLLVQYEREYSSILPYPIQQDRCKKIQNEPKKSKYLEKEVRIRNLINKFFEKKDDWSIEEHNVKLDLLTKAQESIAF